MAMVDYPKKDVILFPGPVHKAPATNEKKPTRLTRKSKQVEL